VKTPWLAACVYVWPAPNFFFLPFSPRSGLFEIFSPPHLSPTRCLPIILAFRCSAFGPRVLVSPRGAGPLYPLAPGLSFLFLGETLSWLRHSRQYVPEHIPSDTSASLSRFRGGASQGSPLLARSTTDVVNERFLRSSLHLLRNPLAKRHDSGWTTSREGFSWSLDDLALVRSWRTLGNRPLLPSPFIFPFLRRGSFLLGAKSFGGGRPCCPLQISPSVLSPPCPSPVFSGKVAFSTCVW